KLVERAAVRTGNEALPNPRRGARVEPMLLRIPSVEAAHDRHRSRIWRPHAEDRTRLAIVRDRMGSHLFVHAIVAALVEQVEVLVGKQLRAGESGFGAHALRNLCARLSLQKMSPSPLEFIDWCQGDPLYADCRLYHPHCHPDCHFDLFRGAGYASKFRSKDGGTIPRRCRNGEPGSPGIPS